MPWRTIFFSSAFSRALRQLEQTRTLFGSVVSFLGSKTRLQSWQRQRRASWRARGGGIPFPKSGQSPPMDKREDSRRNFFFGERPVAPEARPPPQAAARRFSAR